MDKTNFEIKNATRLRNVEQTTSGNSAKLLIIAGLIIISILTPIIIAFIK